MNLEELQSWFEAGAPHSAKCLDIGTNLRDLSIAARNVDHFFSELEQFSEGCDGPLFLTKELDEALYSLRAVLERKP